MSKKKKTNPKDNRSPTTAIGNALEHESDRGCVLVAVGFIDYSLEELLRSKFSENVSNENIQLINQVLVTGERESPPLIGGTWAKNTVAYLIGAIDDECHNVVRALNTLRNRFAHTAGQVTLDDAAIKPIVDKLQGQEIGKLTNSFEIAHKEGAPASPLVFMESTKPFSATRITFMHLCFATHVYLAQRRAKANK